MRIHYGHSGQTMAWSLISVDNVPLCIRLGIDMSTLLLGPTIVEGKVKYYP